MRALRRRYGHAGASGWVRVDANTYTRGGWALVRKEEPYTHNWNIRRPDGRRESGAWKLRRAQEYVDRQLGELRGHAERPLHGEHEEPGTVVAVKRTWATVLLEDGLKTVIPKGDHRVGDRVAIRSEVRGYRRWYGEKK